MSEEKPTPGNGEYLSNQDLCALLRVTPRTTARWREDGNGPPFIRAGLRRVLYAKRDVQKWTAERTFKHRAAEMSGIAA